MRHFDTEKETEKRDIYGLSYCKCENKLNGKINWHIICIYFYLGKIRNFFIIPKFSSLNPENL